MPLISVRDMKMIDEKETQKKRKRKKLGKNKRVTQAILKG